MITHHIKFPDKHDTSVYTILILKYVDNWNYGNNSQEEVQISRGIRVIGVRAAIEVLLYIQCTMLTFNSFFCYSCLLKLDQVCFLFVALIADDCFKRCQCL